MQHLKDILIGLLVAYVVADLLISFLAKRKHPSLVEKLVSSLDEENMIMAAIIAVLSGVLAWYLSKQRKD